MNPKNIVIDALEGALKSGKPPMIIEWLDSLPISESWYNHFNDKSKQYVWKIDGIHHSGKEWIVGIWLNSDMDFIPMVSVIPEVHQYIKSEIYKYED